MQDGKQKGIEKDVAKVHWVRGEDFGHGIRSRSENSIRDP